MNEKQQAKEIYHAMLTFIPDMYMAKQAALYHVDGIIKELYDFRERANKYNNGRIKFWNAVKAELNK